jgi:(S)-2-hydroxyglutarate dehydrogenase
MTAKSPGSVGIIGGGIIGLAVARELSLQYPGIAITVFEKEAQVASHQTGHNSGVVHAGVYYTPGSLKATLCRRGSGLLKDFCEEHHVPYRELGKLIVATSESQLDGLDSIESRAQQNGVPGIARLGPVGMAEIEPFVSGVAALHSPHTAAVDFVGVCHALVHEVELRGGEIRCRSEVTDIVEAAAGVECHVGTAVHRFDQVIVCAGLNGDTLARKTNSLAGLRIIPFRGEYYALQSRARYRVRGMIYPVPDPRYPFLGVHLTRGVDDAVHVGPNAVLALALEGYRRRNINVRDVLHISSWPGTWRLARKHWRHGAGEFASSVSKRRYLSEVRTYLPDLELGDMAPSGAGVRAQAIDRAGELVDDFVLETNGPVLVVRNAPSPAATSSLAIAEHIVSALPKAS